MFEKESFRPLTLLKKNRRRRITKIVRKKRLSAMQLFKRRRYNKLWYRKNKYKIRLKRKLQRRSF